MHTSTRVRLQWMLTSAVVAAVLHTVTPAGPHTWHWLHLLAQKLYYVPILLAASWFGWRAAIGTALAVSALYLRHVLLDWAAFPMIQTEEAAEIASFLLVACITGVLFRRIHRALEQVRAAHEETLVALASSLELRERYTAGHSRRVRTYSLILADAMGITDSAFLESLAQGALLHDVGKIGIPDRVLLKSGSLTLQEIQHMRTHPALGAELVDRIAFLGPAADVVRYHHERYDGTGYPTGLRGQAIPLAARIFAVADTLDALTTDRPYHKGVSFEEAAAVIAQNAGWQFDPRVVDAFSRTPFEEFERGASSTGSTLRRVGDASAHVEPAPHVGVIPT